MIKFEEIMSLSRISCLRKGIFLRRQISLATKIPETPNLGFSIFESNDQHFLTFNKPLAVRHVSTSNNNKNNRERSKIVKSNPTLPKLFAPEQDKTGARAEFGWRIFGSFLDFIKYYPVKVLDKVLPDKAVKAYRTFLTGSKSLFRETRDFAEIYHVLSETRDWRKACASLTRSQLELYRRLPSELMRVAPVLAVSALPMAQNVVFPLALWHPRKFLSSHFWSPEVKSEAFADCIKRKHKKPQAFIKGRAKGGCGHQGQTLLSH